MKKHLLAAAAVLTCMFAAISVSSAQTAVFSYDDHNVVPNAGTYTPGSSFTFSISLAFTPGGNVANLEGLSYWFEQQNPSAPFNFAITLRDVTGSQFTDLQTPGTRFATLPEASSRICKLRALPIRSLWRHKRPRIWAHCCPRPPVWALDLI